jgi:hypothetical protein
LAAFRSFLFLSSDASFTEGEGQLRFFFSLVSPTPLNTIDNLSSRLGWVTVEATWSQGLHHLGAKIE